MGLDCGTWVGLDCGAVAETMRNGAEAGLDHGAVVSLDHGVKDRTMMDQVVGVGPVKKGNTKVALVELETTTADQTMLINTRMELMKQKTTLEQVEVMTTSSVEPESTMADLVDREALEEKELNLRDHGVEHSEFMGSLRGHGMGHSKFMGGHCGMGTVCSRVASMAWGTVNSWAASVDREDLEEKELCGHGMEHSEFISSLCGRGMGHSKLMGGLCGMGHRVFMGGLRFMGISEFTGSLCVHSMGQSAWKQQKKIFRGNLNGHDVRGLWHGGHDGRRLWCGGRGGWKLT